MVISKIKYAKGDAKSTFYSLHKATYSCIATYIRMYQKFKDMQAGSEKGYTVYIALKLHNMDNISAELKIAVGYWPFSDQFQDLLTKTDMLGQICCTLPMRNPMMCSYFQ